MSNNITSGSVPVLETYRLNLREFTPGDSEFVYRLLNSPGWLKNIGTRNINSTEDAVKYINEKIVPAYDKFNFGFYMIELKDTGTPVGMCGLVKREGLEDVDIGFALLPEFEGMGYAYEASVSVMDFAHKKLKLEKIAAITIPQNKGSIKLLEKLGLRHEKMVKLPGDPEELMLFKKSF